MLNPNVTEQRKASEQAEQLNLASLAEVRLHKSENANNWKIAKIRFNFFLIENCVNFRAEMLTSTSLHISDLQSWLSMVEFLLFQCTSQNGKG